MLRRQGSLSVVYLDDSYLQGDSYSGCLRNITATTGLLTALGFKINHEKSVLTPTQTIKFLGFLLDSVQMVISLTAERKVRILAVCKSLLGNNLLKICDVASGIGSLVAALPGVSHGALHYRVLERAKNAALALHKGRFNKKTSLPPAALADVLWWEANVMGSFSPIHPPPIAATFFSDASLDGWGGTDGVTHVGGRWAEMPHHINALELHAASLTLQALGAPHTDIHIRLMLDNTTATVCINKMGGTHSLICNDIAKSIWQWATHRNIWLSAAYVPGSDNTVADFQSQHFEDNTEWCLSPVLFRKLTQQFFIPRVDLFASRLNHQVDTFVSWKPEPQAWAVDAFSLHWKDIMFYAFPPFSVLGRVLSKIKMEQASGILVLPLWPTQPWFPVMMDLLVDHPRLVEPNPTNLLLQGNPLLLHPLHTKLSLLVTLLSGRPLETLAYRKALPTSSPMPGERVPRGNMTPLYDDGEHIVDNGKLIPLLPL